MKNYKKILIIEDDPVIVEALRIAFEDEGFHVEVYTEGKGAIEKTMKVQPDLIILDLVLPGLHGFEILKSLKGDQILKSIPVVVATNLGEESDKNTSLKLGAEDFFIKASVDLEELLKKVYFLLK